MQLTEINKSTDMSDQESTLCCAVPRTLLADTYIDTNFFFLVCETHPWSMSKHSRYTLYSGLFFHRFQAIWYSELIHVLEPSHSYQCNSCENILGVINKFREWSCHSARRRSWNARLCWHVASSPSPYGTNDCLKKSRSASPALVELVWYCTCASTHFGPPSKCRTRRNSVCASNFVLKLGKTVRRLLKY